jgi:hypothetical protein
VAADGVTYGDGSYKEINEITGAEMNTKTFAGYTASDTLAVFSVDMEDLLFDGAFDGGTETREFTLEVKESGVVKQTIAVRLNMTLDDTEASIYHRTGTPDAYRYEKVRDAALTDEDKVNMMFASSDYYYIEAFTPGRVRDLQNAFVWVDHHGVGGRTYSSGQAAPAGYANGTTEEYSEYRLFLKKDQQIGKIGLAYGGSTAVEDDRDCISIELYGAGVPGGSEKTITRDPKYSTDLVKHTLNYVSTAKGLISTTNNSKPKYQALILGKNITLSGDGPTVPVTKSGAGLWAAMAMNRLIHINANSTVIMREHAKVTGFYSEILSYELAPIFLEATARFYMTGGTITGNTVGDSSAAIVVNTKDKSGNWVSVDTAKAVIRGNTNSSNNANTIKNKEKKVWQTFY